ncbi:MAG: hypothetical protein WDN67_01950 [Candidatus Moraniibacteriota bacterium]
MSTIGAIVVTFIVVSLWSKYAYTKGNKNVYVAFEALNNDLNRIAKEAGYKDIYDYYLKNRGEMYAEAAKANIENTLTFLRKG